MEASVLVPGLRKRLVDMQTAYGAKQHHGTKAAQVKLSDVLSASPLGLMKHPNENQNKFYTQFSYRYTSTQQGAKPLTPVISYEARAYLLADGVGPLVAHSQHLGQS